MASTQICTAVSKPKVSSVADRSLSIVFGHADHVHALAGQPVGHAERVLAADGDERVDAVLGERGPHLLGAAVDLVRVGARRAEDRAAPRQGAAQLLDAERDRAALEHALPAVEEADELVAVDPLALAGHGPDHRVEPGAVAAAGEHRRPRMCAPPARARRNLAIARRRFSGRCPSWSPSMPAPPACAPSPSRRRHRRRLRLPRVHPALPPAGLGRARRRRDLGTRCRRRSPSWPAGSTSPSPPSASPTSARRSWRGTAAPASRSHRAIVWQDRRTAARCDAAARRRASSRSCAPPPAWCSTRTSRPPRSSGCSPRAACEPTPDLALGTIDAWLLWNLTGGPDGGVHATEPSNASRTMLFDIRTLAWSDELLDLLRRAGRRPARGAAVERPLRRHRRRRRACRRASRCRGSPATSRRRCSARRASSRA